MGREHDATARGCEGGRLRSDMGDVPHGLRGLLHRDVERFVTVEHCERDRLVELVEELGGDGSERRRRLGARSRATQGEGADSRGGSGRRHRGRPTLDRRGRRTPGERCSSRCRGRARGRPESSGPSRGQEVENAQGGVDAGGGRASLGRSSPRRSVVSPCTARTPARRECCSPPVVENAGPYPEQLDPRGRESGIKAPLAGAMAVSAAETVGRTGT